MFAQGMDLRFKRTNGRDLGQGNFSQFYFNCSIRPFHKLKRFGVIGTMEMLRNWLTFINFLNNLSSKVGPSITM